MRRHSLLVALAALSALALFHHATAQTAKAMKPSYPAVPLISAGENIVGETIRYPKGSAHITAAIVTLAPGGRTIVHKHGVPLFAYILSGKLTVHYRQHGARTYKKGDAFIEAMDVAHYGINSGKEPVRILAVYMGAQGTKNVIPVNKNIIPVK